MQYGRRQFVRATLVASLGATFALTACQPEQRPGSVQVIGTPKSGSVSASVSGVHEADPAAAAKAAASNPSQPTKGDGIYTPVSNVDIYQLISLDVAEITKLTNAVNEGKPLPVQEILAVYEQGKLAKIGENTRVLRRFATDPRRAQEFPEEVAFFKSNTFLDDPVIAAIQGTGEAERYSPAQRRQAIQKGILRIVRYWSVQELLAAEPKLRDGNVDPATGAPHNVDEAWAIYVGVEQEGKYPYSLAATAQSREANFERPNTIDKPLREAFARAQKAALGNDMAGFTQAKADVLSRLNALFYLSAARYLNESVKHAQAGDAERAGIAQSEGFAYYQTIQPIVAKADPEADRAVVAFYRNDPSKLTIAERDRALSALNKATSALGLKESDHVAPTDFK